MVTIAKKRKTGKCRAFGVCKIPRSVLQFSGNLFSPSFHLVFRESPILCKHGKAKYLNLQIYNIYTSQNISMRKRITEFNIIWNSQSTQKDLWKLFHRKKNECIYECCQRKLVKLTRIIFFLLFGYYLLFKFTLNGRHRLYNPRIFMRLRFQDCLGFVWI